MGKNKFVKSAAAVALTASVVATAVAPQASAASYKVNSKDQLVLSSTGKLVKGWKVFGGKLYKNGKLAPAKKYKIIGTGAAQRLYYGPTLKKGYKTASNKTLLFKDGKLADGYKQAGKNERLYKNGKLDKGYTVYTNVEGDKFLYQNGKLKKGDKTATRAGETLLFTDGLLSKGLKEFKNVTYYNGKVANGTIEGKEYDNGVLVTDIASVKAINNTTVEVTFKTSKADVKAADFTIEGLEVTNAAVKQGNDKVVVLTTAAQENGKEYTVKYGDSTKTFTGVSAVIPTSVTFSNPSQQAVVGSQVTVEAQVTVAEGQSKAGIPVTFNIARNGDNNSAGEVVEAITDENGVAKYTYTKYTEGNDNVVAYATGDASKRTQVGKVYWGKTQRLTVSEVTEGNTFANDAKKVYKVKTTDFKDGYVFVAFKENVDVTSDKVVTGAKIVDSATLTGSSAYPYQTTTGGVQYVAVKVTNGEANFTVQGTEVAVTPIVFLDDQFNGDNNATVEVNKDEATLQNTELQAAAPTVTFTKNFSNQLEVTGEKSANAAAIADGTVVEGQKAATNFGGRDFTVKVTDKDGKIAKEGTVVNIGFKDDNFSTAKAIYVQDADGTFVKVTKENAKKVGVTAVVGKNGEAKFRIVGQKDSFAKPTVFFDNGQGKTTANELDDADLQATVSEFTYFGAADVKDASLIADATDGKAVAGQEVVFTYEALDQNGKTYAATPAKFVATFQVTATDADVIVVGGASDGTDVTVKAGQTQSFQKTASETSKVALTVKTNDKAGHVTVNASSSNASLPNKSASVEFVKAKTTAELALETINKLEGAVADTVYATAGILGVDGTNLGSVQNAVKLAKAQKGADLTKAEVQKVVELTDKDAVDAAKLTGLIADATAAIAKATTATTSPADLTTAEDLAAAKKAIADADKAVADAVAAGATTITSGTATATQVNIADLNTAKAAVAAVEVPAAKAVADTAIAKATTATTSPADLTTAEDLAAAKKAIADADKAVADAVAAGATTITSGTATATQVNIADLTTAKAAVAAQDLANAVKAAQDAIDALPAAIDITDTKDEAKIKAVRGLVVDALSLGATEDDTATTTSSSAIGTKKLVQAEAKLATLK